MAALMHQGRIIAAAFGKHKLPNPPTHETIVCLSPVLVVVHTKADEDTSTSLALTVFVFVFFIAPPNQYVSLLKALDQVKPAFYSRANPEERKLFDGLVDKVRKRATAEKDARKSTENAATGANEALVNLIQGFCNDLLLPGAFEMMLNDDAELVKFSDRVPQKVSESNES
jgi:hypothetical protein